MLDQDYQGPSILTFIAQSMIRDMDQAVRSLSEQIKFLTMNMPSMSHASSIPSHSSPSGSSTSYLPAGQSPMGQSHHRSGNMPPMAPTSTYQSSFQQGPPPSGVQWYGPNLPGQSHGPQQVVQQLQAQPVAAPPAPKTDEWDDTYLAVLSTQDLKQLRELLARSNPEIIMPSNGPGPLSQAVILTLVHRVSILKTSNCHFLGSDLADSLRLLLERHPQLMKLSNLLSGGYSARPQH